MLALRGLRPRKVFFSFHYDDVTRANIVRNSDVVNRRYETQIRFYDKSLWEETKRRGATAIRSMIDGALWGSSVTCVLIGGQTWQRPWVRYEILKSMARGNGLFGVHIHNLGFAAGGGLAGLLMSQPIQRGLLEPAPGPSPFFYLAYTIDRSRNVVAFHEYVADRWLESVHVPRISSSDLPWLSGRPDVDCLSALFPVYSWRDGDGYNNFPTWVETAANQARR